MKRILVIFFVIQMLMMPVSAEVIKGGVEYTETEIRDMAFSGVKMKLPRRIINANKVDPFYDENQKLIKENTLETEDRIITILSDGNYCVNYKNNLYWDYFYYSIGKLSFILLNSNKDSKIPYKSIVYDENGYYFALLFTFKVDELYLYDKSGVNTLYMKNGKIEHKNSR